MKKNKFSRTALIIARSIFIASYHRPYKELIEDDLISSSMFAIKIAKPISFKILNKIARYYWYLKINLLFERLMVPGMLMHWLLRKKSIAQITEHHLQKTQIQQVVIFAGGFDSLAWRMAHRYPHIKFFETDHPQTAKIKREIYKNMPSFPNNLYMISSDYTRESIDQRLLQDERYDSILSTLFIAEGLMMYLPFSQVVEMLNFTRSLSAKDSAFLFTYMDVDHNQQASFAHQSRFVNLWLKLQDEPFLWGSSMNQMNKKLANSSFHVQQHLGGQDLKKTWLVDTAIDSYPVASGENICCVTPKG